MCPHAALARCVRLPHMASATSDRAEFSRQRPRSRSGRSFFFHRSRQLAFPVLSPVSWAAVMRRSEAVGITPGLPWSSPHLQPFYKKQKGVFPPSQSLAKRHTPQGLPGPSAGFAASEVRLLFVLPAGNPSQPRGRGGQPRWAKPLSFKIEGNPTLRSPGLKTLLGPR